MLSSYTSEVVGAVVIYLPLVFVRLFWSFLPDRIFLSEFIFGPISLEYWFVFLVLLVFVEIRDGRRFVVLALGGR